MKAKDWAGKFEAAPAVDGQTVQERWGELLKEYGEETAKLVEDRTKTSKPESKFPAADGAVREQQSKFRAICQRVAGLPEALFDTVVDSAVPEFRLMQKKAAERKEKPADDVTDFRKQKKYHNRNDRRKAPNAASPSKGSQETVRQGGNRGPGR